MDSIPRAKSSNEHPVQNEIRWRSMSQESHNLEKHIKDLTFIR